MPRGGKYEIKRSWSVLGPIDFTFNTNVSRETCVGMTFCQLKPTYKAKYDEIAVAFPIKSIILVYYATAVAVLRHL